MPNQFDEPQTLPQDAKLAKQLGDACNRIKNEMSKIIVGQDEVVEQLLIAVLALCFGCGPLAAQTIRDLPPPPPAPTPKPTPTPGPPTFAHPYPDP